MNDFLDIPDLARINSRIPQTAHVASGREAARQLMSMKFAVTRFNQ